MSVTDEEQGDWLVVGHGSVGAALASRIASIGESLCILDPEPRKPVIWGNHVQRVHPESRPFRCILSCVPPSQAAKVPSSVRGGIGPETTYFDWNTTLPQEKAALESLKCNVVDVALLDTLDVTTGDGWPKFLAISGDETARPAGDLAGLGFNVHVVGDSLGDAASLKLLRSSFMKGLEAMLLEYTVVSHALDPEGVVRASIIKNLGVDFASFLDVLVKTNVAHARRRADETHAVCSELAARQLPVQMARTAEKVIRESAAKWAANESVTPSSALGELAAVLSRPLDGGL